VRRLGREACVGELADEAGEFGVVVVLPRVDEDAFTRQAIHVEPGADELVSIIVGVVPHDYAFAIATANFHRFGITATVPVIMGDGGMQVFDGERRAATVVLALDGLGEPSLGWYPDDVEGRLRRRGGRGGVFGLG